MKKPKQIKEIDEKVQARLNVLENLINTEYDSSPAEFERRTGIKMAQVNQWFSGYRALRDKALQRLEEKTGKKSGHFDMAITSKDPKTGETQTTFIEAKRIAGSTDALPSPLAMELAWMFDKLTDRTARTVAYNEATQAILKLLGGHDVPPTPSPAPAATPKRQRA